MRAQRREAVVMELVDGVSEVIDRGALGVVHASYALDFRREFQALIRK